MPKDKYGRNLFIDTLNSAYGKGWKRETGILTHRGTGTFCHSFVPQRPVSGYPSQALRPGRARREASRHGRWARRDANVRVEIAGSDAQDRGRDAEFNSVFDRVMANDSICAPER